MDEDNNTNQQPVNTDESYLYRLIRRSLPADHPFFNFCIIRFQEKYREGVSRMYLYVLACSVRHYYEYMCLSNQENFFNLDPEDYRMYLEQCADPQTDEHYSSKYIRFLVCSITMLLKHND